VVGAACLWTMCATTKALGISETNLLEFYLFEMYVAVVDWMF